MCIEKIKQAALKALNPPYSGDVDLYSRVAKYSLDDFHDVANPSAVLSLIEERNQQYAMKVKAREQRDEAAAMLRDLASATLAIIAISDRKHDAWDAAKAVIAKVMPVANTCTTCNETGCEPRTGGKLHPCVDCAAKPTEHPVKKRTDEEQLQLYESERERELSIIRDNSADIGLRQVAIAMLHVYDRSIHRLKQKLEFKRIKENSPLMDALHQYRNTHNDELVFGFDIAETERIFSEQITNLVRALERFLDNPTPRAEDFDEARSAILAAHRQQGGDV